METDNKRNHPRFDSLNLLSYTLSDQNDRRIRQGMGRTLNVSQSGILIETHIPIETGLQMVVAIGFGDNLLEIKGEPIYCRKNDTQMFETGISFRDVDDTQRSILSEFVMLFEADNLKHEEQ